MELTNEQVIEWLKFAQKRMKNITYSPETFYAIEKAIDIIQYISDTNVGDLISRKAALDIFDDYNVAVEFNGNIEAYSRDRKRLCELPSIQPNNQVHLCDSCSYTYPECPSVYTDVIFGNGIGNDNICACSKYLPSTQSEIIRCNDCKYWHSIGGERTDEKTGEKFQFCQMLNLETTWNFYCGCAERKEVKK